MAHSGNNASKGKMILLYLFLILGSGVAILWAMIKVQWVEGDMWREKSDKRTKVRQVEQARRGNIYSSDGKILATTVPVCDLYLDFSKKPAVDNRGVVKRDTLTGDTVFVSPIGEANYKKYLDSACLILHRAFPDSTAESFKVRLERMRNAPKPRGCNLVMRAMPYTEWMQICRLPGWSRGVVRYVDGNSVIRKLRFHAYGNLAESVIGFRYSYTRDEYSGLEGYYDSVLRGHDGLILCRRLTKGIWLPVDQGALIHDSERALVDTEVDPEHPTIDGHDIVATIDTRLQDIAHYSLQRTLAKLGASAGCAILMEVQTGNVLVSSSLVHDTTGKYIESPNRNVPIADLYEPGSIFKPVILTAMYNDQSFHIDSSTVLPVGVKQFSSKSKEVKDHGLPNDRYPLWKAVAVSSNVAFCELGWRFYNNRRDTLLSQVRSIFPYERLGVDLRGPEPRCRTNSLLSDNDFLRFCYGYTSSVSPLRMATFYNALANKGRMVKPRFCKAIIVDGKVEELPVETINEHVCNPDITDTLRDMLLGVVEEGTGDNIKNETYTIAGKTGTAETSPGAPTSNVTFVGFFPADKPKYTCLVMLRDVYRFGRDAAPVFQNIADCVVALDKELDCRPTVKHLASRGYSGIPVSGKAPKPEVSRAYRRLGIEPAEITARTAWCTFSEPVDSIGRAAAYVSYNVPRGVVPNCYGMTIKDALLLCRSIGLDVSFEGSGRVFSQTPHARTPMTKGMKVHLVLKNR